MQTQPQAPATADTAQRQRAFIKMMIPNEGPFVSLGFYKGWIGGFSEVNNVVSLYDHNWHRLGQFSVGKVKLIKRSTRLCVA